MEDARQHGSDKVDLTGPILMATGVDSLKQVVDEYSLILVEPIQKAPVASESGALITWYRLRVLEYLCKQETISPGPLPVDIPRELQQLKNGDIFLSAPGGKLSVEGVTISQQGLQGFPLHLQQKYVMAVLLEAGGKRATLANGVSGVFSVDSDGLLLPLLQKAHPLRDDILSSSFSSVSILRTLIPSRISY